MRNPEILRMLAISLLALAGGVLGARPGPVAATTNVTAISAGLSYTCAVTAAGAVACWGYNDSGQLGDGTDKSFHGRPVDVVGLNESITLVTASVDYSCAVTAGGGVKCWGSNFHGELGNGTTTTSISTPPVNVVGLDAQVTTVAAGRSWHTCALTVAGGVKCWGYNNFGQLGDGSLGGVTNGGRAFPDYVVGMDSGVSDVRVGSVYTCALTSEGAVQCWGLNSSGQLGDGTNENSAVPVSVVGLESGAKAITAGDWHNCALMANDGVKCWGDNEFGQLGDGTAGDGDEETNDNSSNIALDVVGLNAGVVALDAGMWNTCALTDVGGVKCWGHNGYGQLGNGTTLNSATPVDVIGLDDEVIAISAGGLHTCALMASGTVKCWGGGDLLGDGTLITSPVPVDVLFDADNDGCADGRELGSTAVRGGLRNPKSFWDFFDTPDSVNVRDRIVSVADIGRVAARFGTSGDPAIDPLSAPPASGYHTAFDRSPPAQGAELWQPGPPDGSITIGDIGFVVAQFGHSCM